MSCRMERLECSEGSVVFRISGRIQEQDVETLRALLQQENGKVAIDLKEVLIVDHEAVKLLALSAAAGVELINCPAYIREWIAREGTHTGVDRTTPTTEVTDDV